MKPLPQELRDQVLHTAAVVLFLLPYVVHPAWWTASFVGLGMGLIRETAQHNTFKVWRLGLGSVRDLVFWTLGGLLVWFIG